MKTKEQKRLIKELILKNKQQINKNSFRNGQICKRETIYNPKYIN